MSLLHLMKAKTHQTIFLSSSLECTFTANDFQMCLICAFFQNNILSVRSITKKTQKLKHFCAGMHLLSMTWEIFLSLSSKVHFKLLSFIIYKFVISFNTNSKFFQIIETVLTFFTTFVGELFDQYFSELQNCCN